MAMDRGFAERVARIESGKQWTPDGVLTQKNFTHKRRGAKRRGGGFLTFLLYSAMIAGVAFIVANRQPELVALVMAGDFEAAAAELGRISGS